MRNEAAQWMEEYTVARCDYPQDYENSGKIALVKDGRAAIFLFGHCSCNGTWDGISTDDDMDWTGTPDEMVSLAKTKEDIAVKGRVMDPKDYDYAEWMTLYELIIKWDADGRPDKVYENES